MLKKLLSIGFVVAVGIDAAMKEVERETLKVKISDLEKRLLTLEDGIGEKTK